jgi:hypothetical protein
MSIKQIITLIVVVLFESFSSCLTMTICPPCLPDFSFSLIEIIELGNN